MKIFIKTFLLSLFLLGCVPWSYTSETDFHKPVCTSGNKEVLGFELDIWTDTMYETRRMRTQYCVETQDIYYLAYCMDLEEYHTKVEAYVNSLRTKTAKTCPATLYY